MPPADNIHMCMYIHTHAYMYVPTADTIKYVCIYKYAYLGEDLRAAGDDANDAHELV